MPKHKELFVRDFFGYYIGNVSAAAQEVNPLKYKSKILGYPKFPKSRRITLIVTVRLFLIQRLIKEGV